MTILQKCTKELFQRKETSLRYSNIKVLTEMWLNPQHNQYIRNIQSLNKM